MVSGHTSSSNGHCIFTKYVLLLVAGALDVKRGRNSECNFRETHRFGMLGFWEDDGETAIKHS